jgi:DNA primase
LNDDTKELANALDLEYWFERESRSFKLSRGVNGMQINAVECPACGDRRSRTYLNAESGRGNCFVCNKTFSKLGFVHQALGHDPDSKQDWGKTFDHVREVLREQGWRPKRMTSNAVEIPDEIKLPNSFSLPNAEGQNLQYLENRGVNADLAKYFHLRCCSFGYWYYNDEEDGKRKSQNFGDRLIIPVFDLDGKLVTFQGRDLTGTKDRKYLFPKGLPGTGRYLLNGQNAMRSKRVVMSEGFFDVAATKIALDEEVSLRDVTPVGSFGKHLSYGSLDGNDQLGRFLELQRYGLEEVTIMWDGEWKALLSALEAADLLARVGLKVRIAVLPLDKDPNEVPAQVVREAFWQAKPYSKTLAMQWRLKNPLK